MRGYLTNAQAESLAPFIAGKSVVDLGAGDLSLARRLADMGAKSILAVDKSPMPQPRRKTITRLHERFDQTQARLVDSPVDVAFVSWPANHPMQGLLLCLSMADVVVYLGKNTDGTACGTPAMFEQLLKREVLVYLPDRSNTLIVYGDRIDGTRDPRGEEAAGILNTGCLPLDEPLLYAILKILSRTPDAPMTSDPWSFEQAESV